jgi:hypothetical protein
MHLCWSYLNSLGANLLLMEILAVVLLKPLGTLRKVQPDVTLFLPGLQGWQSGHSIHPQT